MDLVGVWEVGMQISSEFSGVNAKIGFGHYPGCNVQLFFFF